MRPAFREPQEDALRQRLTASTIRRGASERHRPNSVPPRRNGWNAPGARSRATIALIDIQPTQQVFRAGDPVDRNGEAFVPRLNVHGELERQIMMSTGCPGLILYGRRRMGKSTVLRNIVKYLPTSVRVVTITMEDPQVFASEDAFCRTLTTAILADQPVGDIREMPATSLMELKTFLDRHNSQLQQQAARLLLGIDEYQYLDEKIGQGVFTEGLLQTVRTSIQEHRNLTWVFAGSRALEELTHADWSSYLVSARTIEIQPFSLVETRQLLTEPLQESEAWKHNPRRPRFNPMFWGTGGIERIHNEAGGWPHLVQLIAETCVDLVNDREVSSVDEALLEDVLHMSATRGDTVLRQLLERECHLDGEWDWIAKFRQLDVQPPPDDEAIYRSLRRRLIVAETDNGQWQLRVPLMLRWLRNAANFVNQIREFLAIRFLSG